MMQVTIHGMKELRMYMRRLRKRIPNAVGKSSHEIVKDIKQKAVDNINSRVRWEHSGRLAGSFMIQKAGQYSYRLINSAPYATYVEEGTKPHLIRNPLGYTWRGSDYGKPRAQTGGYYMHPGSRAMYFFSDAIDYVWNKADRVINKHATRAFK